MSKLLAHRTLITGLLAPFVAAGLGIVVYATLTSSSADPDSDFVLRLSATALAMTGPCLLTLAFVRSDRRRQVFGFSSKIGSVLGLLSLALAWLPIQGLITRARQLDNLALEDVTAPPFDTIDIHGGSQRLADHAGKVVLLNIWATWCAPCRSEMRQLERLHQEREAQGLVVLGLSTEDVALQRAFAEQVGVSYPLLTTEGQVPEIYSAAARYPANFLIDRDGKLHPAPGTDQPFEKLEAAVEALLCAGDDCTGQTARSGR